MNLVAVHSVVTVPQSGILVRVHFNRRLGHLYRRHGHSITLHSTQMSSYKSSLSRAKQQPSADPTDSMYRQQAQQLQELFPTWSNEGRLPSSLSRLALILSSQLDLQTLLAEVSGDVQVAATRITEGTVLSSFFRSNFGKLSSRSRPRRTMGFRLSQKRQETSVPRLLQRLNLPLSLWLERRGWFPRWERRTRWCGEWPPRQPFV